VATAMVLLAHRNIVSECNLTVWSLKLFSPNQANKKNNELFHKKAFSGIYKTFCDNKRVGPKDDGVGYLYSSI
jgi:hypothetical protein